MPRSTLTTLTKMSAGIGLACLMATIGIVPIASVQAAEPTIAPSPAPVKAEPTKIDPIAQQLLGQWKTKEPIGGAILTLVFAPDGKCYLIFSRASSGKSVATEIQYKINSAPKPMHMDFILPEQGTVQTLFDFAGKELRVQLTQTSPEKPRPTAFQEPTVMQKVSDATTLPLGVELYNPKQQTNGAQQSEAKAYVGAMTRSQQAYFLENNKFASTLEVLGTGIKPETENYRYQVVPQGNGKQQVMAIGQSKKAGLKSYTGAVFVIQNSTREQTTIAALCESTQPSMTAPAMPKLIPAKPNQATQIVCPAGSQLLTK